MGQKRTKSFNLVERTTVILSAIVLVAGLGVGVFIYKSGGLSPKAKIVECTGQKSQDFKCWRERYQQIVANQSSEAALADAEQQYEQSEYVQRVCHQIGHVIGRAATKKYKDIATAYQHGGDFCASGYYHGVIEAVATQIGTDKIIGQINEICRPLNKDGRYKLPYYNCVHGLGHGLMAVYYNELFKALDGCSNLSGDWEQESCYSGVFMENIVGSMSPDFYSKYIKADDPIYPCNAVAEEYIQACYHYQSSHMVKIYNYDFLKVFEQCERAGPRYSSVCNGSLGRDVAGYTLTDPQRTKDICLSGPTADARKSCIEGPVKDFVWQHNSLSKGKGLCTLLSDDLQQPCNSAAESYFALF